MICKKLESSKVLYEKVLIWLKIDSYSKIKAHIWNNLIKIIFKHNKNNIKVFVAYEVCKLLNSKPLLLTYITENSY